MPYIKVNTNKISRYSNDINSVYARVNRIKSEFASIGYSLDWDIKSASGINSRIKTIENELSAEHSGLSRMRSFLNNARQKYDSTESNNKLNKSKFLVKANIASSPTIGVNGKLKVFSNELRSNYGWKEILSGAGYIGTIYNLINDVKSGKSWTDFAKAGVKTYQFLSGAAKTFNNYKKIGNAVGTKTAMAWWVKNITGLKPLGRASTAKNPFTRFVNNLTNKTSPFNAQFKNVVNNFKGANGVGKAIAAWAGVAVTGISNAFSNIEEQKASNGTMSTGRVVAETITETAVDTVLTYGAGIVVGAAVTAVCGTVAAPGVLVVAASGLIVAGLNAGVKALTGKTTTEWISDGILDAGKAIGKAAKKVGKTIAKWFKK